MKRGAQRGKASGPSKERRAHLQGGASSSKQGEGSKEGGTPRQRGAFFKASRHKFQGTPKQA
jgi:hypothetical protein